VWPVQENEHRSGILDLTIVPARIAADRSVRAQNLAKQLVAALDYVGVLCVEMFVTKSGELLLNEIAPRPHNSGHYTIEACVTSQFEQQARILAGAPLGDTSLVQPAVMVNVLGDVWFDAAMEMQAAWNEVLAIPGAHLHLYGKAEPRRARKMGHVTCVAPTLDEAIANAKRVKEVLRIPNV
jgi:5-(carboxyamino)imidazole ribonucleotide synthase